MRLKKLFAGLAAAATMLGGLALGASTASAVDGTTVTETATFTFTAADEAQVTGRTIEAYRIANYVNYGAADAPVYGVVTNSDAPRATLVAALTEAGVDGVADVAATDDIMEWALQQGVLDVSGEYPWAEGTTRQFANYLSEHKAELGTAVTPEFDAPTQRPDDLKWTITTKLQAGLYLFVDTTVSTSTLTQAIPMMVGSGTVTAEGTLTDVTVATEVNMKNSTVPSEKKSADKNTASVGDTITYKLEYTIPEVLPAGYTFAFYDVPGTGLTVNFGSLALKATDAEDNETPLTLDTDYTLDTAEFPQDNKGDGTSRFIVTLTNPADFAGQTITATYGATVNSAALDADPANSHVVTNKLVDRDGGDIPDTEVKTYTYGFKFTKVNRADQPVEGAKFAIKNEAGQYLKYDADNGWTVDTDGTAANAPTYTVTSDANGIVAFDGLDEGEYVVEETEVSDGYQNFKPSFTVTITPDEKDLATFTVTFTTSGMQDVWNLVDEDKQQVINVKTVTELPLTGGAGIVLFSVVGLLLAGAAACVAVRSRSTRRALRA